MDEQACGQAWSLTGTTGTMAAALAANSIVFAMKASATDATRPNFPPRGPLEIEGLYLCFTAIVAATTPIAAGRKLQIFRGTNDAAGKTALTGGTDLSTSPRPKRNADQGSDSGIADARIATTAGLTAGAFTRDTAALATFDLTGLGAAGSRAEFTLYELVNGGPLYLDQGEILVISNPAQIDAVLTWQLTVNVDYRRRDTL